MAYVPPMPLTNNGMIGQAQPVTGFKPMGAPPTPYMPPNNTFGTPAPPPFTPGQAFIPNTPSNGYAEPLAPTNGYNQPPPPGTFPGMNAFT